MEPYKQRAVWAEFGKQSFWWFLKWAFGAREHCALNPSDNWLFSPIHRNLAEFLQTNTLEWERKRERGLRDPLDIMIMMPRGYGKSTVGCAFDLWLHLRNPNLATVISSFDSAKSIEFLNVIKRYLEGEAAHGLFKSLYGVWGNEWSERDWRRDYITHNQRTNMGLRDPSFRASSVSAGLTGSRPDVFRLDDPVVKEKLRGEMNWLTKAKEHLDSSRFAVKSNGMRILYLTPYTDDDVASKVLREEGVWEISPLGMQLPRERYKEGGTWRVFFVSALTPEGKSTLPTVYPKLRLDQMEATDPDDFASQMLCDPVSGSHMPLKKADIERCWTRLEDVDFANLEVSVHCDTSFKHPDRKTRGDFNVIQMWGHEIGTGVCVFLGAKRNRDWSPKEFMEALMVTLGELQERRLWPYVLTDEKETGGKVGMMEEFLKGECRRKRMRLPNFIYINRATKNKQVRIRQSVYAWKTGKVKLVFGAENVESLVYEMTHIGMSKFDDMADAAADAFHPEVYASYLGTERIEADEVVRPLDTLMWTPPGEWSEDEAREVYDSMREAGGDEQDFLGSGVRPDEAG